MTGLRRWNPILSLLVFAASIAVGCVTGPSAVPSSSAIAPSPTQTSLPSPTAEPTPGETPTPSQTTRPIATTNPGIACRPLNAAYVPPIGGLDIEAGQEGTGLRVDAIRIVSAFNPDVVWTGEPPTPSIADPGILLGGRELEMGFYVGALDDEDIEYGVLAAAATLRVGQEAPRSLAVRFGPPFPGSAAEIMLLTIPDLNRRVTLEVEIQWTDRCFSYSSVGSRTFDVIPTSITGACPGESDDFGTHTAALREPPIEVGGLAQRLFFTSIIARWTQSSIFVDGPHLLSWDRDERKVTGGVVERVSIVEANPDLTLDGLHASFYRRRDIIEYQNTHANTNVDPVSERDANDAGGGAFRLRLPAEAGRYVVHLSFSWDSPCATGDGFAVFGLDVD